MSIENKRVAITGGTGFLGRYVVSEVMKQQPKELIIVEHSEFDLTNREACEQVAKRADLIIHLAAQIGGIGFIDKNPGEIFYNNAIMGIELMEASRKAAVEKLIVVGTVCEYPAKTPMPFKEESLWDGYPDEVTAPYGWAKKIQIVQSKAYRKQYGFNSIHLLPVNLYGPEDNFDKELSHVIPALIKRFIEARDKGEKKVLVWGSGKATREFLYVEDAARGIVLATNKYSSSEPVNLGTGVETSIESLVKMIKKIANFKGDIVWDKSKPDGQQRRMLNVTKAKGLGFEAIIDLKEGLERTIRWYEQNR